MRNAVGFSHITLVLAWNVSPQILCFFLKSPNVTLFGYRVVTDVIACIMMRSYRNRVDP